MVNRFILWSRMSRMGDDMSRMVMHSHEKIINCGDYSIIDIVAICLNYLLTNRF